VIVGSKRDLSKHVSTRFDDRGVHRPRDGSSAAPRRQAFNNGNPGLAEAGVFPLWIDAGDDPHMGQVDGAACGGLAM
jgi:hypothetical protein